MVSQETLGESPEARNTATVAILTAAECQRQIRAILRAN
jgi:hypothetical protein